MTETLQPPAEAPLETPRAAPPRSSAFEAELGRVRRKLARLAARDDEIVVGPWFSEVGFEVLYWIPFLRWAVGEFGFEPSRMIAVSRGGTASWYAGIADDYREVFDAIETEDFRRRNRERWRAAHTQKQMEIAELDREVLDSLGLLDYDRLLHPSLMYNLFSYFWRLRESASAVFQCSDYSAWPVPEHPLADGLPDDFVAVRFYFRPSFPDTPDTRALIASTLEGLAEHWDVVLLNTGLHVDDHLEFNPEAGHRILQPLAGVAVEGNLGAQTAVIARAQAFVGTYGGLSYLAPAYGHHSLAFAAAHERYVPHHLDVAREVSRVTGGSLTVLDERSMALASCLGGAW